jgi:cytochrome P450
MFALTRYDSVARALKDASAYSSASGVMMNDDMNQVLRGNTLCSDGADHQRLRHIIAKPLNPTALNSLKFRFEFDCLFSLCLDIAALGEPEYVFGFKFVKR